MIQTALQETSKLINFTRFAGLQTILINSYAAKNASRY